jgi:hypothetical protein
MLKVKNNFYKQEASEADSDMERLLKVLRNLNKYSWVWWCRPVIPALRSLRQENCEFESSLSYIDPVSQMKKKKLQLLWKGF